MNQLFTYAVPFLAGVFAIPQLTIAQSVIDKSPTYRQHDPAFVVDKIEYQKDATVVYFRYSPEYMSASASFFPPAHPTAWILRDDKGQIYPLKALKNLSNGRELISKEVTKTEYVVNPEEVISYDWSGNAFVLFKAEKLNATCELYFDKLAAGVKKIDLVEGIGKDKEYHFNAFDIQVKNTPAPVVEVATEMVEIVSKKEIAPTLEENTIKPQRQIQHIQITNLREIPKLLAELEEIKTLELEPIEVVAERVIFTNVETEPKFLGEIKRIGKSETQTVGLPFPYIGEGYIPETEIVELSSEVAVEEAVAHTQAANYSIFPNPNRGFFNLQNKGEMQKDALVQILDMSGRVLSSQQVQLDAAASQKIELQGLSAGQYLVRVQTASEAVETLPMIVIE